MSRMAYCSGMPGSMTVRLRFFFLFATLFGSTFVLLSINGITNILFLGNYAILPSLDTFTYNVNDEDSFTIRTQGCSIPGLQPLDDSIKRFVMHPDRIKPCSDVTLSLLGNNRTHIWIRQENVRHYNVNESNKLKCCYKSFFRPLSIKDITSADVDDRVEYRKCKHFFDVIEAKDEFVNVVCYGGKEEIFEQYYVFALKKKSRADEIATNKTAYNVMVLGIDAVSRLNFHRTMPKTLQFLKDKDAIELFGYNKVDDNTFPNVIPMLLGIKESELKRTCIPSQKSTFDNCPFVWEWYKQAGYYTALGEDSASLGTFNYLKEGFTRTPTDYYIHTFMNEAERNAGKNMDFNSYLCMNDKYFYKVLLDYVEDLLINLRSSKIFGFFWEVTMSHDHLNYPMVMDLSYQNFFKSLDAQNILDDTIIFLVSDHGIRWGDIRTTKQGRLEERLPFVYILLPTSFQDNYSEAFRNLQLNSRRLTTPFDIYATLNDLVDLNQIENVKIKSRLKHSYSQDRSISLFLPVPPNRTCSTAGIDDHWCTCHRGRKIPTKSVEAMDASAHMMEELNKLVHDYKVCAKLSLAEIMDATEMEVGTVEENEVGWREFMVVVHTEPGGGVFEGTLRHDTRSWILTGTISRLNLYGDQSHCVNNYHLKLYCYCL